MSIFWKALPSRMVSSQNAAFWSQIWRVSSCKSVDGNVLLTVMKVLILS